MTKDYLTVEQPGGETLRLVETDNSVDVLQIETPGKTQRNTVTFEGVNSRNEALEQLLKEVDTASLNELEIAPTQGRGVSFVGVGSDTRIVASVLPILVDGKDISDNWIGVITTQTNTDTLAWNPALHPRDPETGKFVERPFNVPDELITRVDNVSELSADEIVSAADIPDNVRIDGFEGDSPGEITQPTSVDGAAEAAADAIIQQDRESDKRSRNPDREQVREVWQERFEGGFEDTDPEMRDAVETAKQQNEENDEFQELVEAVGVPNEAVHINPENANENLDSTFFSERGQAERKGDMNVVYSKELGTKSTDPVEPEPGQGVSSKDVATILRHETGHGMRSMMSFEDREWWGEQYRQTDMSELSAYATENSSEGLAELIAITTHPEFDESKYSDEITDLAERTKERLRS